MRINPLSKGHTVTPEPSSEVAAPSTNRLAKQMRIPDKGRSLKGRVQTRQAHDRIENLGVRVLASARPLK